MTGFVGLVGSVGLTGLVGSVGFTIGVEVCSPPPELPPQAVSITADEMARIESENFFMASVLINS